jgi:hypothetical protein
VDRIDGKGQGGQNCDRELSWIDLYQKVDMAKGSSLGKRRKANVAQESMAKRKHFFCISSSIKEN